MVRPSSETRGRPMKSSVLVKRLPHWEARTLTTLRPSPAASRLAPSPERKWTWVSPEYQPRALGSDQRRRRSSSSRWPGLISSSVRRGWYSKPQAASTWTLADGEPALAAAVDVGVGGLIHAEVAADVGVPGVVAGVEVVVVAVGLVGDAFGGAEVDAAGQGLAGGVVDDAGVDPVAALFGEAEPEAGGSVEWLAAFEVGEAGGA